MSEIKFCQVHGSTLSPEAIEAKGGRAYWESPPIGLLPEIEAGLRRALLDPASPVVEVIFVFDSPEDRESSRTYFRKQEEV